MAFAALASASIRRSLCLGPPGEGRESPLLPSGIAEFDARLGGFPRGRITELLGGASAGKTSLALRALEAALGMGALAALVDPSRTIFPAQPWATGRLLVVRPENPEDSLRALDALISSRAFGVVALESSAFTKTLPDAIAVRLARLARETGTAVVSCGTQSVFGSSCALRLDVSAHPGGLLASVGKSRQGMEGEQILMRRQAGAAPRRVA